MSELRPNIGYRAVAVTIKTIQSLHGWSRAKPKRRRSLVPESLGRELAAAASLERAGYAEVCVIAPQNAGTEHPSKPAPVPPRRSHSIRQAAGRPRKRLATVADLQEVSLQRHRVPARQALSKHP